MAKLREKEKIDLGPIFNGLEGSRIASDDGSPSFHAYACEEYLTVLESFIDFSEKLPEAVKKRLISQSLFAVANVGTITAKRFEQELKKQERDYLAQPVNSYKFWTTLSLGHTFRQESISVDGKTFHFRASSPPDLTREPFDFATPIKEKLARAENFKHVYLSVNARCELSAFQTGIDELDFLRGIWNFFINRNILTVRSSGSRNPVNSIITGPVHTLHHTSGAPVSSMYWYEPFFPDYPKLYTPDDLAISKFGEFRKNISDALLEHPYMDSIKEATVRYCRSLDLLDFGSSFLKLWSILEFLTNTTGSNYGITVKRCTFLFKNHQHHKLFLQHLRFKRNSYVHYDGFGEREEPILFQLKSYIERLLEFHIFNHFEFSSIAEASEFLDQPKNESDLVKRLRNAENALKYRKHDE